MSINKIGKTIAKEVTIIGKNRKGLHSVVTMSPGNDTGIMFYDRKGNHIINLLEAADVSVSSRLQLKKNDIEIFDAEHILAACAGLGITDLRIQVSNGLPFPDYTPEKYFNVLKEAGVVETGKAWTCYPITKRVVASSGDGAWVEIAPSPDDKFHIEVVLCANGPVDIMGIRYAEDEDFSSFAMARPMIHAKADTLPQDVKDNLILVWDGKFETLPKDSEELIRHTASDILGSLMMLGPIPPLTVRTLNPDSSTMIKALRKYNRRKVVEFNRRNK